MKRTITTLICTRCYRQGRGKRIVPAHLPVTIMTPDRTLHDEVHVCRTCLRHLRHALRPFQETTAMTNGKPATGTGKPATSSRFVVLAKLATSGTTASAKELGGNHTMLWALVRAKLIRRTGYSAYQITAKGRAALRTHQKAQSA